MKMNLLVINGSPRKYGRTGIVAEYIAKEYGGTYIDLSQGDIPLYNGEEEQDDLESVKNLKEATTKAEAFVLCSPEYHSGMTGALKNAFDFLGSDEFNQKPVALLAVAGGRKGGMNALVNMRTVARGVYANVIPKQLIIDAENFDRTNRTINHMSKEKLRELMAELLQYSELYKQLIENK